MAVTTLVAVGDDVEIAGDPEARYPIYSLTKTAVAAAVLVLVREGAVELDAVRRLLDHTSGVRDYGTLAEYHEAVRRRPGVAWDDDEFLARTAAGPQFEPVEAGRTRTPGICCCDSCSTSTAGWRGFSRGWA